TLSLIFDGIMVYESVSILIQLHPIYTLFPYTTLFRSLLGDLYLKNIATRVEELKLKPIKACELYDKNNEFSSDKLEGKLQGLLRSEEHTSELQSRENLVCRLLLEKQKKNYTDIAGRNV